MLTKQQYEDLVSRLEAVEKNSHPPVFFEACPGCLCSVVQSLMERHKEVCPRRDRLHD